MEPDRIRAERVDRAEIAPPVRPRRRRAPGEDERRAGARRKADAPADAPDDAPAGGREDSVELSEEALRRLRAERDADGR